jgi:hypothetical protein
VSLPARERGGIPACSNASQATSSRIRCCGSISSASRGDNPKKSASNPSIPLRKLPRRTVFRSIEACRAPSSAYERQRSAGMSDVVVPPLRSKSQKASGLSTFPGNRQPIPTTAIGTALTSVAVNDPRIFSSPDIGGRNLTGLSDRPLGSRIT